MKNPIKEIKLYFHAIVAIVNGTIHRSTLDFFSAIVTADTDSLFKNRDETTVPLKSKITEPEASAGVKKEVLAGAGCDRVKKDLRSKKVRQP
jgi:hypothetical protein